MKPDWDKLMKEYEGSTTTLVADVDCTAAGKSKCEEVGVRGYPTIKHGDPNDLQDYKGGRTLADLKKFAEGLGPQCSPANLDLCDEEKKKLIAEYMKLSEAERNTMITEKEKKMETIEADFKTLVDGLQKKYQEANDAKDKNLEEIKSSGLGMLKSVNAYAKTQKSEL